MAYLQKYYEQPTGTLRIPVFLAFVLQLAMWPSASDAKPLLVATVPALAQIAEAIGDTDIRVITLTRIGRDPNIFSPLPGHARTLSEASMIFSAGFGLESGWLPGLLKASGNEKIMPGREGYFTGSDAIEAIGVPRGMTTQSMDAWSPDKNPHWWLDPELGIKVAKMLAVRLSEIDPVNAGRYLTRAVAFTQAVNESLPRWREVMLANTRPVITYHSTYVYFMHAMDVELAGFVEPKAGIEPSTRHMSRLIRQIKKRNIRLIWVEPYNNRAIAKRLADEAGIRIMVLPDAVEGYGLAGYIGMFDTMVERIARWSQ